MRELTATSTELLKVIGSVGKAGKFSAPGAIDSDKGGKLSSSEFSMVSLET